MSSSNVLYILGNLNVCNNGYGIVTVSCLIILNLCLFNKFFISAIDLK